MTFILMLLYGATTLPVLAITAGHQLSEILQLSAEPDYKSVTLRWQYPRHVPALYAFQIHYCELQAWGSNRCRTKMIDDSSGVLHKKMDSEPQYKTFSVIISGLRMATNYSFEVRPMESRPTRFFMDTKTLSRRIIVPTKGFSAKASLCLPDISEVEVATGPYFGGRIAVETAAGEGELCAVDGDGESPRDTYILRIQHKLCGSQVNRTAVATFILVQENLPILTHSTRRFLVLCTFQPETLTVRAGLNLPSTSSGSSSSSSSEADSRLPSVNEVSNDVHAAPLKQALHDFEGRTFSEETEAQMVLFTVVVAAGMVVIGLSVWWFIPLRSKPARSILSDDSALTSTSTVFENFENSLRDGDFETASGVDSCGNDALDALRDGVCNEVLHETCSVLDTDTISKITIQSITHSEV